MKNNPKYRKQNIPNIVSQNSTDEAIISNSRNFPQLNQPRRNNPVWNNIFSSQKPPIQQQQLRSQSNQQGIQQHSQQQNVQYIQSQSTNNSGNENDLFTPSEIIELTREIISKLSACRTRAEQFQIKYDIALFNETWLKPSVNSA